MNQTKALWPWVALLLSACLALGMTACANDGGDPEYTSTESASADGSSLDTESAEDSDTSVTESEEDSKEESESISEGESESGTGVDLDALPRFDYLGKDILPFVTIDPAVYASMQLTLPAQYAITDGVVDDYIRNLRMFYRTPAATDGDVSVNDRPMTYGDSAFLYFHGVLDGVAFQGGSNWSSATPRELVLGSGSFIPGFEEGLIGLIPSSTSREHPFELHVTFPEDYGKEELNGKDVIFYIYVEYAVAYDLPPLDRAFIVDTLGYQPQKDSYANDTELLEEFRTSIRTSMEESIADELAEAKTDALWDHLWKNATFTGWPEEELAYYIAYYENNIHAAYNYYAEQMGADFLSVYPTVDAFARAYLRLGENDDWHTEVASWAKAIVEREMLLHAIGEQEGMETVSDTELEQKIQSWIDSYKEDGGITMTREEILALVGGEDAARIVIFQEKLEAWLLSRVSFTFEGLKQLPFMGNADIF